MGWLFSLRWERLFFFYLEMSVVVYVRLWEVKCNWAEELAPVLVIWVDVSQFAGNCSEWAWYVALAVAAASFALRDASVISRASDLTFSLHCTWLVRAAMSRILASEWVVAPVGVRRWAAGADSGLPLRCCISGNRLLGMEVTCACWTRCPTWNGWMVYPDKISFASSFGI